MPITYILVRRSNTQGQLLNIFLKSVKHMVLAQSISNINKLWIKFPQLYPPPKIKKYM